MTAIAHPSLIQPENPDGKLWRYMDLEKFISILQTRSLFFARADRLGDPYEGYYARPNVENTARMFLDANLEARKTCYVSCWHMNKDESAAMWQLFTSLNEAVCVRTSYRNLFEALPEQVFMGQVRYIDYELQAIDVGNYFNFIAHKRVSFEHEKEVRAVLTTWGMNLVELRFPFRNQGFLVPINLESVIKEVYISPSATALLRSVVEGLLRIYGLLVPVLQSEVNAPPAF